MNNQDKMHILSRAVIIDDYKILLCKTLDFEANFYFLPGGHVKQGESAKNSLLREIKEETAVDCVIKRFLGCLEYSFEPFNDDICHNHEYNFIFEVESETLKSNKKILSPEKHIELIWMPIVRLKEIEFEAKPLKNLLELWLNGDSEEKFVSEMI